MAFEYGQLLPRRYIPQPRGLVVAARYQDFVVRGERHYGCETPMALKGHSLVPCWKLSCARLFDTGFQNQRDVPQLGEPIHCRRRQGLPVRGEGDTADAVTHAFEAAEFLAAGGIPELD